MITVVTDYAPCVAVRRTVFIDEQGIAEADEIDAFDGNAIHLLATDNGTPVGTARILLQGEIGIIGRICVLPSHRGRGLGKKIVRAALTHLKTLPSVVKVKLSAQHHAISFYESLGFVADGPFYDDAGIPHRTMQRPLRP